MNPDLSYEQYQGQLAELVGPAGIAVDAARSSPSEKFAWCEGWWRAEPFHGVTIITPPFVDDPVNHPLYVALADFQQALVLRLGVADIGLLPVSSLHLTVADLLYAKAYDPYRLDSGRAAELRAQIAGVFDSVGPMPVPRWRVRGLSAFGAGVTAVLDCPAAADYHNVIRLRAAIYDLPVVSHPGPFTAHISFFYLQHTDPASGQRLAAVLNAMNRAVDWGALPAFQMRRAEMRAFRDMMAYTRGPDWPVYEFGR